MGVVICLIYIWVINISTEMFKWDKTPLRIKIKLIMLITFTAILKKKKQLNISFYKVRYDYPWLIEYM